MHDSFSPAFPRVTSLACAFLAAACARKDPAPVVQIAVGAMHACARRADGAVLCWGSNRDGQLGSDDVRESGPREVPFVSGARDLAASGSTSCAVIEGGEVECFGTVWTKSYRERRQRIPGVRGAVSLMMSGMRACALGKGGAATCWGPGDEERRELGGWPPAPDERFRGAGEGGGAGGVLCARLADRVRCSAGRDDRLDFPGAEAAAVLEAARQICVLRSGAVACRTVSPAGELVGPDEVTRAGFAGLVAFDRFLCGALAGGVACYDSALPPRDRRARGLTGFGAVARLAAGPGAICGLTSAGDVLCTERAELPAGLVLPASRRAR